MKSVSRRQFLRADFNQNRVEFRPPWAQDALNFVELCTRCGDCIDNCPEKILSADIAGLPVVNFQHGACSFCGQCVDQCRAGALTKTNDVPWRLKAWVSDDCLARQGIVCQICREQCDADVISFPLQAGITAVPVLDQARCSGCGACVATCPSSAVTIKPDYSEAHVKETLCI